MSSTPSPAEFPDRPPELPSSLDWRKQTSTRFNFGGFFSRLLGNEEWKAVARSLEEYEAPSAKLKDLAEKHAAFKAVFEQAAGIRYDSHDPFQQREIYQKRHAAVIAEAHAVAENLAQKFKNTADCFEAWDRKRDERGKRDSQWVTTLRSMVEQGKKQIEFDDAGRPAWRRLVVRQDKPLPPLPSQRDSNRSSVDSHPQWRTDRSSGVSPSPTQSLSATQQSPPETAAQSDMKLVPVRFYDVQHGSKDTKSPEIGRAHV